MFHKGASISIDPERTVAALERDFFEQLGLCVQVFRQAGPLWIQTINTDQRTLKEQNEAGRESCEVNDAVPRKRLTCKTKTHKWTAMPLLKPFRISNDQPCRLLDLVQQPFDEPVFSTWKNCRDSYELRIGIPAMRQVDFTVFIECHVLHIITGKKTGCTGPANALRIDLPAQVREERVIAHIRPYGIKIILPKMPWTGAVVTIKVPVLAGGPPH